MKWFLLLTLAWTGAVIVTVCAAIVLIQYRLRRRNRVRPSEPDDTPLYWLVSPQPAARLHRRLVAAARMAQMIAERHRPVGRRSRKQEPATIVVLCGQLERHAASLDAHLPFVVRMPAVRRRSVVAELTRGVVEIERTAARLSVMSAEISAPTVLAEHTDGLTEMTHRLDALESANATLRELEAGAGVVTPRPLVTRPEPARLGERRHERPSGTG